MGLVKLCNRAVVRVHGPDATRLLHNITTNDVEGMQTCSSLYNLILNSKGRYIFDFFVVKCGEYYLLDCEESDIDALIELLKLYRLTLKVRIMRRPEYAVAFDHTMRIGSAGHTTTLADETIMFQDPRHEILGVRAIVPATSNTHNQLAICDDTKEYDLLKIKHTVPNCLHDMVKEVSFPLQFGMDRLNAISMQKGCYIGQEIVTRMHCVGVKKILKTVTTTDGSVLPAAGDVVSCDNAVVGTLLSAIENFGLCMLATDKLGFDMKVGNVPISIYSN